ncbi:MAG: hypothetical protein KJ852_01195 [Gammaproteobacteria bacterium]|nr:hypothetical protein [Gammaproteobacteria bacterium]MBU0788168.1 hypothetical protein [Gammaproteobacteria bacterium]MBU0815335.1 hypothetical protein [Gammaproteobacteria bacterium]MBU1785557.1 hypothetical protein [Gammaproteobacteria bacterium]
MSKFPMNHEDEGHKQEMAEVPAEFPWDPFPASLSGAQSKVAARLIDGRYVSGLTEDERRGRYLMCVDLVEQLVEYTERKHLQRPDLTLPALLDQIDDGVRKKGWEVGAVEFDWIMGRVRVRILPAYVPRNT